MKKALITSIVLNIIFIVIFSYIIHKKGGIEYLKVKLKIVPETVAQRNYGVYYKIRQSVFEVMPTNKGKIIFLGDSLTDYCNWDELFNNSNIKNRGIGGDVINGVIDRLDSIIKSKPKKIFLMIGINDLRHNRSVDDILIDYEKLLKILKQELPETDIYVKSILPTDNRESMQINDIMTINQELKNLTEKYGFTFIDLFDLFTTKDNLLDPIFTFDGLHLNGKGYLIWKNEIERFVY